MRQELEISEGTNYAQMVFDGWAMAFNPNLYQYKVVIPMDEFKEGLLDAYNADLLGVQYIVDPETNPVALSMRQITGSNGSTINFVKFYLEEWLPSGNNLKYTWNVLHNTYTMA